MEDVTFNVRYHSESNWTKTAITIHDKYIQCAMTPNIEFNAMDQMMINNSENEKYRERSFGLRYKGNVFNFVAKHRQKRNEILKEILDRFPSNAINVAHWRTIQSATSQTVLQMDHSDDMVLMHEVPSFSSKSVSSSLSTEANGLDHGEPLKDVLEAKLQTERGYIKQEVRRLQQIQKDLERYKHLQTQQIEDLHRELMNDVQRERANLDRERQEFQRKKSEIDSKHEQLKNAMMAFELQKEEHHRHLSELELKRENLDAERVQFDKFQKETFTLREELDAARSEMKRQKREMDAESERLQLLKQELERELNVVTPFSERYIAMNLKLQKVQMERDNLMTQQSELKSFQHQKQMQQMQKDLDRKQTELQTLREEANAIIVEGEQNQIVTQNIGKALEAKSQSLEMKEMEIMETTKRLEIRASKLDSALLVLERQKEQISRRERETQAVLERERDRLKEKAMKLDVDSRNMEAERATLHGDAKHLEQNKKIMARNKAKILEMTDGIKRKRDNEVHGLRHEMSTLHAKLEKSQELLKKMTRQFEHSQSKGKQYQQELQQLEESLKASQIVESELQRQNDRIQADATSYRKQFEFLNEEKHRLREYREDVMKGGATITAKLKYLEVKQAKLESDSLVLQREKTEFLNMIADVNAKREQLDAIMRQRREELEGEQVKAQKLAMKWQSTRDEQIEIQSERAKLRTEVLRLKLREKEMKNKHHSILKVMEDVQREKDNLKRRQQEFTRIHSMKESKRRQRLQAEREEFRKLMTAKEAELNRNSFRTETDDMTVTSTRKSPRTKAGESLSFSIDHLRAM